MSHAPGLTYHLRAWRGGKALLVPGRPLPAVVRLLDVLRIAGLVAFPHGSAEAPSVRLVAKRQKEGAFTIGVGNAEGCGGAKIK